MALDSVNVLLRIFFFGGSGGSSEGGSVAVQVISIFHSQGVLSALLCLSENDLPLGGRPTALNRWFTTTHEGDAKRETRGAAGDGCRGEGGLK